MVNAQTIRGDGHLLHRGPIRCETISHRVKSVSGSLDHQSHSSQLQFLWVAKGGGRARIDGTIRGFGPSTAIFVPHMTLHAFEFSPGSQGWIISIEPGALVNVPDQPILSSVTAMSDQNQLAYFFDAIEREYRADRDLSDQALLCHAGLLAVWFLRHQQNMTRQILPSDSARRRLMRRFILLLNERYQTQKSVTDYATELSVTTTHLTRVCRQTTGKPASTLIQERLMDAAQRQLSATNMRVSEIATGLGFENAAYFTRLFTQKTGNSPTKYRSQSRH